MTEDKIKTGLDVFKGMSKSMGIDIILTHVPTGEEISFPSFITEYSDDYTVSFGSETIFGRSDPVQQYQGTTRKIQISFDVVSESLESAKLNLQKATKLAKMMYPVYSYSLSGNSDMGRTIKAPPLMRLRYANLIQNVSGVGPAGLLGTLGGFSYKPDIIESGTYVENGEIIPKIFKVTFAFQPLHEKTVGYDPAGNFIISSFPYGVVDEPAAVATGTTGEVQAAAAAAATNNN